MVETIQIVPIIYREGAKKAEGILENVVTALCFRSNPLSARKLVKLVYLVDVYHQQMFGTRLTDVHFRHYRYGAWSPEIGECVEELCDKGILVEEAIQTSTGYPAIVPKPATLETVIELPESGFEALKEVLSDWGSKNPNEVVQFTKSTLPFLDTPYDEEIDFKRVDAIAEYAKKQSISEEEAAIEDILPDKPLVEKLLEASQSLRKGGHLLSHDEVFPKQ